MIEMLVNKKSQLDKDYIPDNLIDASKFVNEKCDYSETEKTILVENETLNAFMKLREDFINRGFKIYIDSAYRSYEFQENLLKRCIKQMGEKAYTYCALPGTSEHQTGMAIDLGYVDESGIYHMEINESTKEYEFLEENSYKYGFILRYPKFKENITGYNFEPWHYRYVGIKLANELYERKITLDEYYDIK